MKMLIVSCLNCGSLAGGGNNNSLLIGLAICLVFCLAAGLPYCYYGMKYSRQCEQIRQEEEATTKTKTDSVNRVGEVALKIWDAIVKPVVETVTQVKIPEPQKRMGELKTALVRTLRDRDRASQSDSSFWSSFHLLVESEEHGVVVVLSASNNYGYQRRTGNYYGDSQAWENLIVATRKGYCFLGRLNAYQERYLAPYIVTKDEGGLKVVCGSKVFPVSDEKLTGTYDHPFKLPEDLAVQKVYDMPGGIVVIDDEKDYMVSIPNDSLSYMMVDGLLAGYKDVMCPPISWDETVESAKSKIEGLEPNQNVSLVLVDGNFSRNGTGFNTASLIPHLRKAYPNAILFANSGKGINHANHNRDLLRAGCDMALSDEDYGYKSHFPKIFERIAQSRPEIVKQVIPNLNKILKI